MSTLVLRRTAHPAAWHSGPALVTRAATDLRPQVPAVALTRDGQDGVLVVEVPGADAARDLAVRVTADRLTVAGTRRSTSGAVATSVRFSRTVALPQGVGAEAVSAGYTAGVLRVRVAGMFPAPVEPETTTIAITSDAAEQPAEQPEQPAEGDQAA